MINRITCISDTHTKQHNLLTLADTDKFTGDFDPKDLDLPGGDILIHAGDIMNSGYVAREIGEFFEWFDAIPGYDKKVLIAGNHDRLFELQPAIVDTLLEKYPRIIYLEDSGFSLYDLDEDTSIKFWGSPWQPEFYNWAFNLPRGGDALKEKWALIPEDTDILITHGPAQGYRDTSGPPYNTPNLGCELLTERIKEIKPSIHVCGHIHGGYGYATDGDTHFINASVLDERYQLVNKPLTFDWDSKTNRITFL